MTRRDKNERRETVLLALGCVVIGAEVLMVLVQSAFPTHPVPSEFHALAFLVATALFGSAAWQNRKSGGGDA